jgi:hypothetical protein
MTLKSLLFAPAIIAISLQSPMVAQTPTIYDMWIHQLGLDHIATATMARTYPARKEAVSEGDFIHGLVSLGTRSNKRINPRGPEDSPTTHSSA